MSWPRRGSDPSWRKAGLARERQRQRQRDRERERQRHTEKEGQRQGVEGGGHSMEGAAELENREDGKHEGRSGGSWL